ncbi:hypothetical protein [Blastococcus sp. SYSU D00695]
MTETPRRLPRCGAIAPVLLGGLLLAGCSGGTGDGDGPAGTPAVSAGAAETAVSTGVAETPAVSTGADTGTSDQDVDAATDAPGPDTTDVVLSFVAYDEASDELQAGGYVRPVVEDGGTCTLVLVPEAEGAAELEVTVSGLADASTTVCGGFSVAGDDLVPGTWTAVLRYGSAAATGESAPVTVELPE